MKIGILTFHNSRNYGAVLQAYGLKEVLKRMGHRVDIINYRTPAILKRKSPYTVKNFFSNPVKYVFKLVNGYPVYRKKVRNFTLFENVFLNVTPIISTGKAIEHTDYDVIIIGSDQVWSPIITSGPDPVYWGAFKPKNAKLISYAASSGDVSAFENKDYDEVGTWLERFDQISVREERLKEFVESHSKKKAKVVLDPTLLAGRSIFEEITLPRLIKEPYVLLYYVECSPSLNIIAKKVAAMYHAKIVRPNISGVFGIIKDLKNSIISKNASVGQLLSLIKYSECVVALSFHGTALSLIYEKDFFSVKGGNMARVETILSKVGLMDRIVSSSDDIQKKHIDYSEICNKLEMLREESENWLNTALGNH